MMYGYMHDCCAHPSMFKTPVFSKRLKNASREKEEEMVMIRRIVLREYVCWFLCGWSVVCGGIVVEISWRLVESGLS